MKTYETWEAIKMLKENEELEFRLIKNSECIANLTLKSRNGTLHAFEDELETGLGCLKWMILNATWKLIQKPVPLLEATYAFATGKNIRCEYIDDLDGENTTAVFKQENTITSINSMFKMISTGKWFIEE